MSYVDMRICVYEGRGDGRRFRQQFEGMRQQFAGATCRR